MMLLPKEAFMQRPIVVCLLAAMMLLTGRFVTLTHGQSPGTDLKPTFISPTPGLYVNCWPAFTVSYPKESGWCCRLLPGKSTVSEGPDRVCLRVSICPCSPLVS
jgi:hypothetical protein